MWKHIEFSFCKYRTYHPALRHSTFSFGHASAKSTNGAFNHLSIYIHILVCAFVPPSSTMYGQYYRISFLFHNYIATSFSRFPYSIYDSLIGSISIRAFMKARLYLCFHIHFYYHLCNPIATVGISSFRFLPVFSGISTNFTSGEK